MDRRNQSNPPKLAIVIPCYNEEKVLPLSSKDFLAKLEELIKAGKVSDESFILFSNDGSKDSTWELIKGLSRENPRFRGVSLSRNRGHQNALLAGLCEARKDADIIISCDCDGQDDIGAMGEMVEKYSEGAEIVYGVRKRRELDTWFKRSTAEFFYRLMNWLGAEVVFNHADYRLTSARVLEEFEKFGEVNLFLRGMFPLVGFKSDIVYYDRKERVAGESHYPFFKMLGFAMDGITSLSVKPIRMIAAFGFLTAVLGFAMIVWCLISYFTGRVVPGWASNVMTSCLIGGAQLISIGVIGEYIGKIYLETKKRPRYIIEDKT